jgi:hypothetical protein
MNSHRDDLELMMRIEEAHRQKEERIDSNRSLPQDFEQNEKEFDFGELGTETFDFFVDLYKDD